MYPGSTTSHDSTHTVEWKNKLGEWVAFPHEFYSAEEARAHIDEVVAAVPIYRLKIYRIVSVTTQEVSF